MADFAFGLLFMLLRSEQTAAHYAQRSREPKDRHDYHPEDHWWCCSLPSKLFSLSFSKLRKFSGRLRTIFVAEKCKRQHRSITPYKNLQNSSTLAMFAPEFFSKEPM